MLEKLLSSVAAKVLVQWGRDFVAWLSRQAQAWIEKAKQKKATEVMDEHVKKNSNREEKRKDEDIFINS